MSTFSFDSEGLLSAAAQYESAASEAHLGGSALAALSLDAGACGGTGPAQSLRSALNGFSSNQASVAAGSVTALQELAQRLRLVSGLGVTAVEQSSVVVR